MKDPNSKDDELARFDIEGTERNSILTHLGCRLVP